MVIFVRHALDVEPRQEDAVTDDNSTVVTVSVQGIYGTAVISDTSEWQHQAPAGAAGGSGARLCWQHCAVHAARW